MLLDSVEVQSASFMLCSIRLLPTTVRGPDRQRLGEMRIGGFVEQFAVYPVAGTVEDVADRWNDELDYLVKGAQAIGLQTATNMAWVLYRVDQRVLVHQNLITPAWGGEVSPNGTIVRVPPYTSKSKDGRGVSEWTTTLEAVRAFLEAERFPNQAS